MIEMNKYNRISSFKTILLHFFYNITFLLMKNFKLIPFQDSESLLD